MKVILKETIPSLGIIGSEATVAKGYARNFLFPQGKAVEATEQNRKLLSQEKSKFDIQIAKEKALAEEMAKRLEGVNCSISARVSDEDRLYGSITARDIRSALIKQDIEIEKRMILLNEPIKMLGSYQVPIRIYKEVEPEITVEIVAE
ncbi:MAG: 50S ribosomal protein L9 [Deltaproteobacteria bacterium]|nr:50S ribosomal protein L9 [Deltaproteobacteria bacterium]